MNTKNIAIIVALMTVLAASAVAIAVDDAEADDAFAIDEVTLTLSSDGSRTQVVVTFNQAVSGQVTVYLDNNNSVIGTNTISSDTWTYVYPGVISDGAHTIIAVTPSGTVEYTIQVEDGIISEPDTPTPGEGIAVTIEDCENCTISVTVEGAAIVSGDSVEANDELTITAAPDEGYEVTVITVNGTPVTGTYTVTGDESSIVIAAECQPVGGEPDPEPETVTITFMVDDEEWATVAVEDGDFVMPEDPTKDGYEFVGWFTADGDEFTAESVVTESITVHAQFEEAGTPDPTPETFTVTIQQPDNGTIAVVDDVDLSAVGSGTELTFMVIADDGYVVEGESTWTVTITEDTTVTLPKGTSIVEQPEQGGDSPSVDMEEMYVSGTYQTNSTFLETQIVIVDGTLTIASGAWMTIYGQLVIPEGAELVVEPGAYLILMNDREDIVVADIDGTLTIEQEYSFDDYGAEESVPGNVIITAGTVAVSGILDVYGVIDCGEATLMVEADGEATVQETGVVDGDDIVIHGTLNVYGTLGNATVNNHGTVVFNSDVQATGDVTVNMLASGAVVDIRAYTANGGTLTVTDANLVFRAATSNSAADTVTDPNIITLGVTGGTDIVGEFSGLVITESVTGRGTAASPYVNSMDVSGSMTVSGVYVGQDNVSSSVNADATVDIVGNKSVTVTEGLTVGSRVTVNNGGTLTVSGSVTATASNSSFTNSGTIDIEGEGIITVSSAINSETGVNATKYTTTSGTSSVTIYVRIDTALATVAQDGNTIRQLTLLGTNTMTASAVLPTGVTLNTAGATLNIGRSNGSDVVLTVQADASVRGTATAIVVNGTLYAEDKTDIVNVAKSAITADVYSEQLDEDGKAVRNGWAKWTNVYTAMAEAQEGDVVEVYKDAGYVDLTSNLTVPEGVTLVVAADKAPLLLRDGVTLTVNGTLRTSEDVYAESMFGTSAMNIAANESTGAEAVQSSAVVVNGYLYSAVGVLYGDSTDGENVGMSAGAPIAGAYYEVEGYSAISPLAQAVAIVADIEGDITVNGAVSAGDVVFTATDDCDTIVVSSEYVTDMSENIVASALTVDSLTLDGATLVANGAVNGTIVAGDAYLQVTAVSGLTVTDDDGMEITGIVASEDERAAAVELTQGSAELGVSNSYAPITVAEGATMTSAGATVTADLIVYGTVEIANNSWLASNGTVTVQSGGLVNVEANETLSVAEAYVYGTLTVAEATSTSNAGIAMVSGTMGVGISAEDVSKGVSGTSGTIEGSVTFTDAYVAPGATLSDAMQSALGRYVATTFQVEGSVWFVYYSASTQYYTLPAKAPVENAYVTGWNDGTETYIAGYPSYPTTADATLEAVIDYNIYYIVVTADAGIGSVAIDGVVLVNLGNMFATTSPIAAGSHSVTYTLKSGYEGSATLTTSSDYATVSGLTFSLSGTDDDGDPVNVELSLAGTTASDSSIIVNVDSGSDDGLGLTDILLIVLVILIIVMAIIVALRLMRS